MASKQRSLQLEFTVQGTKRRVLPLTANNVESVFKTGVLTRKGGTLLTFCGWLGIPDEHRSNPVSAASWWVRQGEDRRWRVIVYYLDVIGETGLAEELMPYSEPPSDPSLTIAKVTPILMELRKHKINESFTCGGYVLVPKSRHSVIQKQCTTTDDKIQEAATYYVTHSPFASWDHLARGLYRAEEKRAMEIFEVQLPKQKNHTLTMENVLSNTEGVEMPKESFGDYLDMPYATYNEIVRWNGTGKKGRKALFTEFLSHHPYPTWKVVIKLLEALEKRGKARAGLAQEVKKKYLANESSKDERTCEVAAIDLKSARYEIDVTDLEFGEVLGKGGFGAVFQGKWRSKGMDIALKKVHITPDHSDVKVMKELGEHPNIISFYGFAYNHPETIIVTALARRGSLYDYLHIRKEKPTEQQSLTWAKQIAYGMAYMHKLDYVHRDLKSSNVLFSDDMVAQVCDFGTARSLSGTTFASRAMGTHRWMAPEVAREDAINKQCDVFSFSLVVWELMEHDIPYPNARTDVMACVFILNGERPTIGANWPKYLSSLIQACWADSPNDRPTFCDIVTSLDSRTYFKR